MLHHDAEAQLSLLLSAHAGARAWEHRHPLVALRAARLLGSIPPAVYHPTSSREAAVITASLRRSHAGVTTRLHEAVTMLELPDRPGHYDRGRERATQRRQARRAERLGVTWRRVADDATKRRLLDLAVEHESHHARAEYRFAAPDLAELLEIDLWLVAEHDGVPLLLSVTAVDRDWSLLSYFRTLQDGDAASAARYLMTGVLAEELVARGVRHLCDTRTPFRLNAGLRHFSRMVGFRTSRVVVD